MTRLANLAPMLAMPPETAAMTGPTRRPVHPAARHAAARCLLLSALLAAVALPTQAATTLTRTSSFSYDTSSGLLTKEIIEPGNSALCLVTETSYDTYGNKTTATTRNCNGSTGEAAAPTGDAVIQSRTTRSTYDARGQFPVSGTNALGHSETRGFDPRWGTPLSLTGPNGLTTAWQYDGFGRKTLEIRADGTRTQWNYRYCSGINDGTAVCPSVGGAAGAWLVQETPLASDGATQTGPSVITYHDALDRVIRKETQGFDGNGASTPIYQDTQYDSLGRPYMASRPYYAGQTAYWTTLSYDLLGRPVQETRPDNSTTATAYNGLTLTVTDPLGRTRTTLKNSRGLVARVTDAANQSVAYAYDPFGNLISTTDALGNTVTLTYDLRGRKTQLKDPDMGTWSYAYDALGQLVRQTDAKAQVATLAYDTLGRMTRRSEADLISAWYYDAYKGGAACDKGIGKLCQAETSTGYNRTISYDALGRLSDSATTIDVPTPYTAAVSYDANGRVQTRTYPSGLVVQYAYTALGYLRELRDATSNALYWRADALDAEGHLLLQTAGNGVQTAHSHSPANGRIAAIQAGAGNSVQNLAYQYDALGNLSARSDANQNLAETFSYDNLNRLTSATVNSAGAGIVTQSFAYDALGNLTAKNDLGNYAYPQSGAASTRPHAVSQIALAGGGAIAFAYDANGALTAQTHTDAANNALPAKSRAQFYTSFNMPQSMSQGSISAAFYYGPEHQRVKQISSTQGTTVYLNPGNDGALFFEKDIRPDGSIELRSFIVAAGQSVAIVKAMTVGGTTTSNIRYLHRDALGSITAVTDESGTLVERLAYEPFGKRRTPAGNADPDNTLRPQTTDRGFTGHEMIDEIGLIHMNGRVYDPLVARFLSADPLIQDPNNLQSHNRYAYVFNSPLNGTDPSGYFWVFTNAYREARSQVFGGFREVKSEAVNAWIRAGNDPVVNAIRTILIAVYAGPEAAAVYTRIMTTYQTGSFTEGFTAGVTSYATASAFNAVGDVFPANTDPFMNTVGHAAVGCARASATGGDCGDGALSAAAGAAWSNYGVKFDNPTANFVVTTTVGGTASVLGGGKFANGATTAAFGYLFNFCAHNGCFDRDFTLADAKQYWQSGNGASVSDVSANEINLSGASYIATKTPNVFQVNLSPTTDSYYIYGTVTGVLDSNGNMSFRPDTYNFDYKNPAGQTVSEMSRLVARNAGTYLGHVYNGSGTPYQINFSGSQALPPDTVNRLRSCSAGNGC